MNLYVEKCFPSLRLPFVKFPHLKHSHPYSWLPQAQVPVVNQNRRARIHWYCNVSLFLTYLLFLICRTGQVWADSTVPLTLKFFMAIFLAVKTRSLRVVGLGFGDENLVESWVNVGEIAESYSILSMPTAPHH